MRGCVATAAERDQSTPATPCVQAARLSIASELLKNHRWRSGAASASCSSVRCAASNDGAQRR